MLNHFSYVQLFGTLWTVVCQAPLSMEFSRQECWNGLLWPPPGHLPHPGIEPMSLMSPALAGGFFTTDATQETQPILFFWSFRLFSICHYYKLLRSCSCIFKDTLPEIKLSVIESESCSVLSNSSQPHGPYSSWSSRPEYWSGSQFPSPVGLPNTGIKPRSPALWAESLPADPPRKPKNTGVGSLFLLQGIPPTQESNQGLLHCRQLVYQLSCQGSSIKI